MRKVRAWAAYIWIGLLVVNVGLRVYKAGEMPIGMDYDHVREAYHATELFTHFDIVIDNVLFLELLSIRVFQSLFGLGVISNYVSATFWFVIALFPLYFLIKDLFGSETARWGIVLTSFSLIGFTAPRMAQVTITSPFFAFLALLSFYRLLRTGKYRYVGLLGVALGLGVYSFPVFKGIFLILPVFFIMMLCADFYFRIPGHRTGSVLGIIGKFSLVGVIFGAIVYVIGFPCTHQPFSFSRLHYILFGYSSNGHPVNGLLQLWENVRKLLSEFLPMKYVLQHHFIIPRFTGSAEAIFYISPVITLFFLIFWLRCLYIFYRFLRKQYLGRYFQTESACASWIAVTWRKEYDWLFAAWIFVGGCAPALLSDHVAARRWIYAWLWIYPLAAAGIVSVAQKFSAKLLPPLLAVTLLSQAYLMYNPYLMKPWRTMGPTVAVIDAMKQYCAQNYPVFMTAKMYHWVKYYRKITPLGDCQPQTVPDNFQSNAAPYALFSLMNDYGPVPFGSPEPVIEKPYSNRGMVKDFRDQWGFHDFRVTEVLRQGEERAATAAPSPLLQGVLNFGGNPVKVEHPRFDIGDARAMFDGNVTTLARTAKINPAQIIIHLPNIEIQRVTVTVSHASQVEITVKTRSAQGIEMDWGKQTCSQFTNNLASLVFERAEPLANVAALEITVDLTKNDPYGFVHINEIEW